MLVAKQDAHNTTKDISITGKRKHQPIIHPTDSSSSPVDPMQKLDFTGLTVSADVSLPGVIEARKRRRREQSTQQPANGTESSRKAQHQHHHQSPNTQQSLNHHQSSTPFTSPQLSRIHNYKEKRLLISQQQRDAALLESAVKQQIIEQKESSYLETESNEESWRLNQFSIAANVDQRTAEKIFNLQLDSGPYSLDFTRDGHHLVLGGKKGHVAVLQWATHQLLTEFNVKDQIRDVQFLHNYSMFAVAQSKQVYIYDQTGLELHVLKHHIDPTQLQFLPYHYLLASIGNTGYLKYQDTSTGQLVTEHRTKLGACHVMRQNPSNAILHLGHKNGTVTLWSPNMTTPLVTMLTHQSPVLAATVDLTGNYMVTSGQDCQVKVWDLRKYQQLHSYYTVRPTTSIEISQTGLMSLCYSSHVAVWKDALRQKATAPYIVQEYGGHSIAETLFVPYEDVLGVTHDAGYSSIVIPGSGYSHFDSNEVNIMASKHQHREAVVHSLLEKLQPSMISLKPQIIGMMDPASKSVFDSDRAAIRKIREKEAAIKTGNKEKARGGQKSSKRWKRKRVNIIDEQSQQRAQQITERSQQEKKRKEAEKHKNEEFNDDGQPIVKDALSRFSRKKL